MILYHFTTSPFSRRVRLVLAHKGLSAELRDARAEPGHMVEVKKIHPLGTVPVLVDGDRVVCDSTAICQYLDRRTPAPPLLPSGLEGAAAMELVAVVDGSIRVLTDLGLHYYALHDHPGFAAVRAEYVGRAQRGLDWIAEVVATRSRGKPEGAALFGDAWSYGDIVAFTMVAWLDGLPARAETFAPAKQISSLGWSVPASLLAWAAPHRERADVRAL